MAAYWMAKLVPVPAGIMGIAANAAVFAAFRDGQNIKRSENMRALIKLLAKANMAILGLHLFAGSSFYRGRACWLSAILFGHRTWPGIRGHVLWEAFLAVLSVPLGAAGLFAGDVSFFCEAAIILETYREVTKSADAGEITVKQVVTRAAAVAASTGLVLLAMLVIITDVIPTNMAIPLVLALLAGTILLLFFVGKVFGRMMQVGLRKLSKILKSEEEMAGLERHERNMARVAAVTAKFHAAFAAAALVTNNLHTFYGRNGNHPCDDGALWDLAVDLAVVLRTSAVFFVYSREDDEFVPAVREVKKDFLARASVAPNDEETGAAPRANVK